MAAAEVATRAGYRPLILGDAIEGEASEVGKVMAGIARQVAVHGQPAAAPCVLISGGETTVTVGGAGRGGRNVEFLLSLAVELDGRPRIFAIAGDTDGVDGAEEVAGAIVTPDSLERARQLGLNARRVARRQRRARVFRRARRSGRHRADADQCQRLPRRAHQRPMTEPARLHSVGRRLQINANKRQ